MSDVRKGFPNGAVYSLRVHSILRHWHPFPGRENEVQDHTLSKPMSQQATQRLHRKQQQKQASIKRTKLLLTASSKCSPQDCSQHSTALHPTNQSEPELSIYNMAKPRSTISPEHLRYQSIQEKEPMMSRQAGYFILS